jgi:hypothetical protein
MHLNKKTDNKNLNSQISSCHPETLREAERRGIVTLIFFSSFRTAPPLVGREESGWSNYNNYIQERVSFFANNLFNVDSDFSPASSHLWRDEAGIEIKIQ